MKKINLKSILKKTFKKKKKVKKVKTKNKKIPKKIIKKVGRPKILKNEIGEDFISFLGYNPLSASIDVSIMAQNANVADMNYFKSILLIYGGLDIIKSYLPNLNLSTFVLKSFNLFVTLRFIAFILHIFKVLLLISIPVP